MARKLQINFKFNLVKFIVIISIYAPSLLSGYSNINISASLAQKFQLLYPGTTSSL